MKHVNKHTNDGNDFSAAGTSANPDARLTDLQTVRSRLLNQGLVYCIFIAPFGLILSLIRIFEHGWNPIYILHISLLALVIAGALFRKQWSYQVRAFLLLGAFLVIGAVGLPVFGLVGGGLLMLILFAILTALVFGTRAGLIACAIDFCIIAITGTAVCTGTITFPFDIGEYATSVTAWSVTTVTFFMFVPVVVIALGKVHEQLAASLHGLRESEEKLSAFMNSATDSFSLLDSNLNFVDVNEKALELIGKTREEVIGRHVKEIAPDIDKSERYEKYLDVLKTGKPFKTEASANDPRAGTRHLIFRAFKVGNGMGVIASDITDFKQAEEELKHETAFRRVLGTIANEFITASPGLIDQSITRALEAIGNFVNADRSYVIKFDFEAGTISNTHEWCREGIEAQIENLQDIPLEMFSWVIDQLVDLQVVHIPKVADLPEEAGAAKKEFEAEGIRSLLLVPLVSGGKCVGTVGFDFVTQAHAYSEFETRLLQMSGATLSNILDRKRAIEALQESEEKYRVLVENAAEAIVVVQDGELKFINHRVLDLLGYAPEEMIGKPFIGYIHPEDRETLAERYSRRTNGEDVPTVYSFRVTDKAGETKWAMINIVRIEWEGRPATLNFLADITERVRAEEEKAKIETQFHQAQRMEAIGTLAGGVAHDFNNLLMGIQGRTSLMLNEMDPSHSHHDHLRSIEECVDSAANLTKQLLGFARGGRYQVEPANLNDVLTQSSKIFVRTKKEITMHAQYQQDIWPVEVDHVQIEQVLLNLYVNAWHSMPAGGDLYLATENVVLDSEYDKPFFVNPGRYVKISVTDTGMGMDKKTQEKIFEPFFTTKEMGRGTGLGLASAYGIIKNHGGLINVYSEKGEGTTFSIYFPASDKPVLEKEEESHEFIRGSETILFVDDEDTTVDVGKRLLERLGYRVFIAKNGKEAIDVYKTNADEIDMVLLDMIMPDMSGGETFERLKEIAPEIRVLLSSGYSLNGQAQDILNRGCRGFLQKPFNMTALSQKIREILDEK